MDTVSVIIPVYNEEKYIENLIKSIKIQDYDFSKIEIIFVDGNSNDDTIELINKNLKDTKINYRILINEEKITPKSVNMGIKNAKNDIIIRLDAHSEYPENYISKCVYYLNETGADNVGCLFYTKSNGTVGEAIAEVLSSNFGVGNSKFRTNAESGYVDTVPYGTFRRELFEKIGYFNEELLRSEDNEINYRIRKNGGKVYLFNDIGLIYHPRDTIGKIANQAKENGKYSVYTSFFIPGSMGIRHLVPLAFVLSIIVGIVICLLRLKVLSILFACEIILYLLLDVIFSFKDIKKSGIKKSLLKIFIYPIYHISYGIGSILGFGMIVKKKLKKSEKKYIEPYQYNDKTLRDLQLKSLEMFKYMKQFCEENNLLIYFCGGCCIGTLRNKGFIPWDDDIDVFMPRSDYEKLKQIWNEKADTEKYECVFPTKEVNTRNQFLTINDNNTTFIKTHQKDLDINHGIVIDVLPLDGCPTSRIKRKMQKFWALIYSLYITGMVPKNHGSLVTFIGKFLLGIIPIKSLRYKIWKFAEKQMTKYKIEDCEYITELCSGPRYMKNEYLKALFEKAIYKEFEGELMPIPVGYDEYLKIAFGDYMKLPPKEKQIPEHNVVFCDINNSYKKYKGIYYCKKGE